VDTVLAVLAYIAAVIIPVVLGAIAAPNHTKTTKILIWSAAVPLGIWCFAWELQTEATMMIRIIIGLIVGTFVFVIVPETMRWMSGLTKTLPVEVEHPTAPQPNEMGDITGNRGIVTQGQRGDNAIGSK
jgi:hypothetical protein